MTNGQSQRELDGLMQQLLMNGDPQCKLEKTERVPVAQPGEGGL